MWVLIALLVLLATGLLALALLQGTGEGLGELGRHCPSCHLPLVPLTGGPSTDPPRSYEVLVCPRCTNAVTMVHGTRSRCAYCPVCQQRSLETPCIRLPELEDGHPRVAVHEICHLCGHEDQVELPEAAPRPQVRKRGKVLPFRKRDQSSQR